MMHRYSDIDKLVDALSRPIYNLRMARGITEKASPAMQASARTRKQKAEAEIHDIVLQYVKHND